MKIAFISSIVLLSVLRTESKLPISTGSECEWGVSYWCQSHETATRCGQLEYCQSIWQDSLKKESTELHSIECTACHVVIKYLKIWINENSTEAEVKKATLSLCDVMTPIKSECHTIVNDYFGILWIGLQNEIDPTRLCVILSCSTSSAITNKQYNSVSQVGNKFKDLECKICKAVVGHFYDPDAIEQKLENKLDLFCSLMPKSDEKEVCTGAIKIILDTLKNDADKIINSDLICTEMGYCDALDEALESISLKSLPIGDEKCDLCEFIVKFLKPYVDSNRTEMEVKEALDSVCNLLPESFRSKCTDLVDQYFWVLIRNEFDNDAICSTLDLCNQEQVQMLAIKLPDCVICKLVVEFLKVHVESNTTESDAEVAVESFCGLLPNSLKPECKVLIQKYFHTIWSSFENEIDSNKICNFLHLCNDASLMMESKSELKSIKQELCDTCELISFFLRPYVDKNSTEEEVEVVLEKLCLLLPSPVNSSCTTIVDSTFVTLWKELQKDFDDDKVCQILRFCNNNTKVMNIRPIKGVILCEACEFMMKELDRLLESNETESAVMHAIQETCDVLPATYSKECTNITRKYGETIYKLIVEGVSSKLICGMIGVCTGDPKTTGSTSCSDCQRALKSIELILSIESQNIVEGMKSFCNLLPDSITGECDALVAEYGEELVSDLISDIDPLEICKDLDFCTSFNKHLIGTQRITCKSCSGDIMEFENLFSTKSHYFMNMMISSCKNIPEETNCSTIMKIHGRTVYQKIHSTLMNHRDVCQHVCGVSHSKKGHPHLAFNAAALASENHL